MAAPTRDCSKSEGLAHLDPVDEPKFGGSENQDSRRFRKSSGTSIGTRKHKLKRESFVKRMERLWLPKTSEAWDKAEQRVGRRRPSPDEIDTQLENTKKNILTRKEQAVRNVFTNVRLLNNIRTLRVVPNGFSPVS